MKLIEGTIFVMKKSYPKEGVINCMCVIYDAKETMISRVEE